MKYSEGDIFKKGVPEDVKKGTYNFKGKCPLFIIVKISKKLELYHICPYVKGSKTMVEEHLHSIPFVEFETEYVGKHVKLYKKNLKEVLKKL